MRGSARSTCSSSRPPFAPPPAARLRSGRPGRSTRVFGDGGFSRELLHSAAAVQQSFQIGAPASARGGAENSPAVRTPPPTRSSRLAGDPDLAHRHLVLRQRAALIGADHRDGAQRLDRGQLFDQHATRWARRCTAIARESVTVAGSTLPARPRPECPAPAGRPRTAQPKIDFETDQENRPAPRMQRHQSDPAGEPGQLFAAAGWEALHARSGSGGRCARTGSSMPVA